MVHYIIKAIRERVTNYLETTRLKVLLLNWLCCSFRNSSRTDESNSMTKLSIVLKISLSSLSPGPVGAHEVEARLTKSSTILDVSAHSMSGSGDNDDDDGDVFFTKSENL